MILDMYMIYSISRLSFWFVEQCQTDSTISFGLYTCFGPPNLHLDVNGGDSCMDVTCVTDV